MPYIVTTKTPVPPEKVLLHEPSHRTTRRAVATLEEARDAVLGAIPYRRSHPAHGESRAWRVTAVGLPESGGSVGPLPDGTLIEVERVTWRDIARDGPFDYAIAMVWAVQAMDGKAEPQARLIDAFNARQS